MGVALFKDGAWTVFHEDTFTDRLNEGWSLSEEIDLVLYATPDQRDDTEIILNNTLPKCSTIGYGIGSGPNAAEWLAYDLRMATPVKPLSTQRVNKLSNKKVRAAAEKAGIADYAKARIKSLRKALTS